MEAMQLFKRFWVLFQFSIYFGLDAHILMYKMIYVVGSTALHVPTWIKIIYILGTKNTKHKGTYRKCLTLNDENIAIMISWISPPTKFKLNAHILIQPNMTTKTSFNTLVFMFGLLGGHWRWCYLSSQFSNGY